MPLPSSLHRLLGALLALPSALLLVGCGAGVLATGPTSGTISISGRTHGGNSPVSSSTVSLWEASSSGYQAASTLITPAVTTDNAGNFSITASYTCPSPTTQMYITASQGDPGPTSPNNPNLVEMAALGNCGSLTNTTPVIVNELTTVAAVWALAPFIADYQHIGTSSTNAAGLSNAMASAQLLVNSAIGQIPHTPPAGVTLPVQELNSLANILATCVNSAGGSAGDKTLCGNLFSATTVGSSVPTDTVGAALNIARTPANNVSNIWKLAGTTGPFQTGLSSAPNDWTLAIGYTLPATTSSFAFDASGNLWLASNPVYELSATGVAFSKFPSMTGGSIAIDASGNIWDGSGSSLQRMPASLGAPSTFAATGAGFGISALAIDGAGEPWYSCSTCSSVSKASAAGVFIGTYAASKTFHGTNLSIDPSENIWLGNDDGNYINVLTNSGTAVAGAPFPFSHPAGANGVANDSSGNAWIVYGGLTRMSPTGSYTYLAAYPTGGLDGGQAVAIDGGGNAWIVNNVAVSNATNGSISEFTNAGTAVTPVTGYVSTTLQAPQSIAIDGSGNVWVGSGTALTEFLAVGLPVVTPFALGLKNGTLATEP